MSAVRSRGVSLIEALVALAVMAFGLLGVVGMQGTLRSNADVSRQRAEAVRMAQEKMESMRSFGVLTGAPAGEHDYAAVLSGTDNPAVPVGFANTAFVRTTAVRAPGANDPKLKSIEVEVAWLDRRTAAGGPTEKVKLTSTIAEIAPILSASLSLPGDRAGPQRPLGRNAAIPPGAVDLRNGTSRFAPPGASPGVSWIFSNATGQITDVCTSASSCSVVAGWVLSGFIRFIPLYGSPTNALAEAPTGSVGTYPAIEMTVALTLPSAPVLPPACFVGPYDAVSRVYYCFVPVDPVVRVWSGRSVLGGASFAPNISTLLSDFDRNHYKVCRYTPTDAHTQPGGNAQHPLDYTSVNTSLTNQNFLVHSAGDNSASFLCPDDDPATPLIQGNTFFHQPTL